MSIAKKSETGNDNSTTADSLAGMVKADLARVPIFDPDERRGNRRLATLVCVYSVARYERMPADIVAALFRDATDSPERAPRPIPVAKHW